MYRALRNRYDGYRLKSKTTEEVFTYIYRSNEWEGIDSVSGKGSDIHQTKIIAKELPTLLKDLNLSTLLDIPCGDFHWMQYVNLNNIYYIGADIVKELIKNNIEKYGRNGIRFRYLNLLKDKLPKADLVLCRDCFVHYSFKEISLALGNICNSQSKYILTTTFIKRKENRDIVTGQWRILNLEQAPFNLPKPIRIINEGCSERDGAYKDKALGLWRIADIRERLTLIGKLP